MGGLGVTIADVPFAHRLYHFVLAFPHWEYAGVGERGESFEPLSQRFQSISRANGIC